jgi:CheY-like chemotaxis protein
MHMGWIDVHAVLERALEICRSDIANKQQELVLQLEARHTRTAADAVRIQQALWNLVRNASKFTPVGGTITIRTGNTGEETIWLRVEDTGIGFKPEMAAHLFDAFEQGGRHITRRFGGLGLGLAITRSIVEAHRGRVYADSRGPDQGAIFGIELPLRSPEADDAKDGAPALALAQPPRSLRILLVEDHKDTRTSMEHLLRRYRHEVKSADTARCALDLAASESFDVVISDLGLPDLSGLALMRELRERYGLRGIAMSGYGMEEDIARSRAAGFMFHLTKPVGVDRLKLLLTQLAGSLVNSAG